MLQFSPDNIKRLELAIHIIVPNHYMIYGSRVEPRRNEDIANLLEKREAFSSLQDAPLTA